MRFRQETTVSAYRMDKDLVIAAQDKEIAMFLATLPSESLKNRAETADQKLCWDTEHSFQKLVSECWLAYLGGKNDPLRPRLNSGELARDEYNFIWRVTDFYLKFWGLVQVSFDQIQPRLAKAGLGISFSSALELFCEALREEADNDFCICLKPYYEVSVSKLMKLRKLQRKIDSGKATPTDRKELAALSPKNDSCSLTLLILKLCLAKADRHELVMRERLEDVHVALQRLADSAETMRRYGGSYAWKNGKLLRGQKKGGIYTGT